MKKHLTEEELKQKWDRDAALRREFDGDFETFAAWAKADANGQVKILRESGGLHRGKDFSHA